MHRGAFVGRAAPVVLAVLVSTAATFADIAWQSGAGDFSQVKGAAAVSVIERLAGRSDARHAVVQFKTTPDAALRSELEQEGVTLLSYLGDRSYFASLDGSRLDAKALASRDVLAGARAIQSEWKLHPALLAGDPPSWSIVDSNRAADPTVGAYVLFHSDAASDEARALCEQYESVVLSELRSVNGFVIEGPVSGVLALAYEDAVMWIEPPLPQWGETLDSSRVLTQVEEVHNEPDYELDGSGVSALIYDVGRARIGHVDYVGRLSDHDATGMREHTTNVAGILGGDGTASGGLYAGMAPGVTMEVYGFQPDGPSPLYMDPGDLEADFTDAYVNYGVQIANCSIGTNIIENGFPCEWQGNYGATSAALDSIVAGSLGSPFRLVFSIGNERAKDDCGGLYGTTGPPAGAKNHIAVGAVNSNDDSVTYFTGWGPTDDGRLRPDVMAPGCEANPKEGDECSQVNPQTDPGCGVVFCSSSAVDAYAIGCGSSAAAPMVTGGLSLVLQDFMERHPDQDLPRCSTLKALLVQTAVDLEGPGPGYESGYGSVRFRDAIDFMRSEQYGEYTLDQGDSVVWHVRADSADEALKITVAWDDPAATPNVETALVNDVDLYVYSPCRERHYVWTLNPEAPDAPAVQTADDHLNNLEQVFVADPEPGLWRIEVHGYSIPQGPQTFSICSSHPLHTYAAHQAFSRALTVCSSRMGDLDCDCDVDISDLARMLGFWGAAGGVYYDSGDLDIDSDIDIADLTTLLSHYAETCD